MKKIIMICIVLLTGLVSCSNYNIMTFFIGNGAMQYFVPPIEFSSENRDAFVDFTYRNTDIDNPDITCNFSVIFDESEQLSKFDKAGFIISNTERIALDSLSIIFADHGAFKIRYSSKITKSGFIKLFSSENVMFFVSNEKETVFIPSSDFETAKDKVAKSILPATKKLQ